MGNTLIEDRGKTNLMKAFDTYTEQEIGVRMNVFFENKGFKTLHYKMHQQNLLVKVHLMRKQLTNQELYIHQSNFTHLINILQGQPNLLPFHKLINFGNLQKPQITEQLQECNKDYVAVARQLIYQTLEERLQSNYTLPKCLLNYITLQLLTAVNILHNKGLYHGHIRSSNILLTSQDFLILSDFACYKPSYLNELEIIRNVYKSSIQKCTLAPEKYNDMIEVQYLNNMTQEQIQNMQQMDMFSIGCVLAEIYTGETLFSLEQLLQFKKGEYEPIIKLEGIVGDIIRNLIQLQSEQRYSAIQTLQLFYDECCNQTYEMLYYIGISFNVSGYFMQPDFRIALIRKIIQIIDKKQFQFSLPLQLQLSHLGKFTQICKETEFFKKQFLINFPNPIQSFDDDIVEQIDNCGNLIQKEFKEAQQDTQSIQTLSMVQRLKQSVQKSVHQIRQTNQLMTSTFASKENKQEYIIIILWIFNQMRNCRFMQTKLCGLELIEYLTHFIGEDLQYNLLIPHLGYFCEDSEQQVQQQAFTLLLNLLKYKTITILDAKETLIFKLYIWEQIKNRMQDISGNPQLALRIGDIAEILTRFNRIDEKTQFLQILSKKFQDNKINELVLITTKISEVLKYYEQSQTLEILTYLISQINTPTLKVPLLEVFFDIFKYYVGTDTTNMLLVCLQLNNRHEMSLFHIVKFIRIATEQKLLEFDKIKQYLKEMSPLLLHHNRWIREEVQDFVVTLLQKYSQLEIFLHFQPYIVRYLKLYVPHINVEIFYQLLQKPVSLKWFEQKNGQMECRFPHLNEREQINYLSYFEDYFKKSKPGQDLQQQLPQIQKNQIQQIKLNQRINEFIEASFRVGLVKFDTNNYKEQKSWEEFLLQVVGKTSIDKISRKKIKYLQELQLQLQYQIPQASTQWVNLLNYSLNQLQIQIKAKQLQIQDMQFQRMIQQTIQRPFKIGNTLVTTITEHKGIITSIQKFNDNKKFITGSYDGTVKIYDMKNIEEDFTSGSIATIPIKDGEMSSRVTALCVLEGTESFVVGTNTGAVSLYTKDKQSSTFLKGDSEIRKIVDQDSFFMYVTEKGTLAIEDIRCRNGLRFNIGRQRGLVTSMVQTGYTSLIGTINGYLILYDMRSTLIVNLFQLINHDDQPLPIYSIANMKCVSQFEGFNNENLVGLGFQSNNNEVGFWDINKQNENLNPSIFLHCSDKKHPIIETPRLQSVLKTEQFTNYNNNLQQQCFYDFFNSHHQVDLIQYLKDPLTQAERTVKERWLRNTKNLYLNLKTAFESKSTVTSLISLQVKSDNNRLENAFITASTDRAIQSWVLQSDSQKQQDRNADKEFNTNVICSPYNSIRKFRQCPSGDVMVIQDYELKTTSNNSLEHKDCITDMTYLDSDNQYLVTASRDHTVKIWK